MKSHHVIIKICEPYQLHLHYRMLFGHGYFMLVNISPILAGMKIANRIKHHGVGNTWTVNIFTAIWPHSHLLVIRILLRSITDQDSHPSLIYKLK